MAKTRGLSLPEEGILPSHWHYDIRVFAFAPRSQIPARVGISMGGIPTPETGELGLPTVVACVHKATVRAATAGVVRVRAQHRHARSWCFVAALPPQWATTPGGRLVAPALPHRHRAAKVGQGFEHPCSLRVFGLHHDAVGEGVVDVAREEGRPALFCRRRLALQVRGLDRAGDAWHSAGVRVQSAPQCRCARPSW